MKLHAACQNIAAHKGELQGGASPGPDVNGACKPGGAGPERDETDHQGDDVTTITIEEEEVDVPAMSTPVMIKPPAQKEEDPLLAWVRQCISAANHAPTCTVLKSDALERFHSDSWAHHKETIKDMLAAASLDGASETAPLRRRAALTPMPMPMPMLTVLRMLTMVLMPMLMLTVVLVAIVTMVLMLAATQHFSTARLIHQVSTTRSILRSTTKTHCMRSLRGRHPVTLMVAFGRKDATPPPAVAPVLLLHQMQQRGGLALVPCRCFSRCSLITLMTL